MKIRKISSITAFLSVVILISAGIFLLCYRFDNKYTAREKPDFIYLIHGWEIYRGKLLVPSDIGNHRPDEIVFIGQYGGFEGHIGGEVDRNPHGSATYRINLALPPGEKSYTLELPEIYSAYKLYINGLLMAQMGNPDPENYEPQTGNSFVTVHGSDKIEIIIAVSDYSHFYSGVVYPPAFGESAAVISLINMRFGLRAMAVAIALCIGGLYLGIWVLTKKSQRNIPLLYAALCACFAIYICHPVVKTLFYGGMNFYTVEITAYCMMLLLFMLIQERIINLPEKYRLFYSGLVSFGVFTCCWSLLMPYFLGGSLKLMLAYSVLINIYTWISGTFLILSAAYGVYQGAVHSKTILTGEVIFGCALVMDRIFPVFEPIRFGWFTELAGGVMVALTGVVMAKEIAREFHMRLALEERVESVNHLLETQRAYYPVLLQKEEEARAARHDLRHHMLMLRELAQSDTNKLTEYLNKYETKYLQQNNISYCNHYVADMILRKYAALAQQHSTPMDIKVSIPETIMINDVDFCVILSNLLENSLEATSKLPAEKRHIAVRIRLVLSRIGIFVENSFDGILKVKYDRFFSRKLKGGEGIGINSVRAICRHYDGSAEFYADENNVFHSEIILSVREETS
ncbi:MULTISPECIES: GHKL domain-containing protein [Sedimentibacter]|uniref:GHKL domain-containing protein n=1 Tax=Sedimentibacter hydroxybenzoicus DSM 7310 TaxID=1123245 RepID=A0A974BII6_SEDHY|nr:MULTISPECIES: GHKL domain-containing protein [Sedimentibacter]NYB73723.1 GHKL domain-containing protein [Sedimentibacter hydroxybenzoicus DSM 7310]